jgi:O-antigen/teichoic acid export membrane protein
VSEKSLRFARNFSWNLLGQFGAVVLNFLILPFVIHRLGVKAYGLYILMYSVSSYLQLCSFGAAATAVKYVASLTASGSHRALRRLLAYSLAAHGLGGLAGALVLAAGARFVAVRIFHVPPELSDLAQFVLICAGVGALFLSLTQFSFSILSGLQRFESLSFVTFLQSSLMTVGMAVLLVLGFGLKAVALLFVGVNFTLCLLAAGLARRFVRLSGPDGPEELAFRTFATWSLGAWLGPLAWIITNQVDKVFLARTMSLTAVTLYSVPSGLLARFQTVPVTVSAVVAPMMSELRGPDADESMRRMYLKAMRFLLWVTLPILILLFMFMPQFLGLWLHGDFGSRSVWPSRLLVLSQMFYLLVVMPNATVFSRDKPSHGSFYAWAQALTCLAAWRLLAPTYGLLGIAMGSLLGQALPALVYVVHVHRMIHLGTRRFLSSLRAPVASAVLISAALFPFHEVATTWPKLVAFSAAAYALFYGSTWLLMHREDRELMKRFLRTLSRGRSGRAAVDEVKSVSA